MENLKQYEKETSPIQMEELIMKNQAGWLIVILLNLTFSYSIGPGNFLY